MKAMTPSALPAAGGGSKPIPRGRIIKRLWAYIKKFDLQHKINKRLIHADEKLKSIGLARQGTCLVAAFIGGYC